MYTRASVTDILARILARQSARVGLVGGEDVRVGVHVSPVEFQLNIHDTYITDDQRQQLHSECSTVKTDNVESDKRKEKEIYKGIDNF